MRRLIALPAAALVLVACSADDPEDPQTPESDVVAVYETDDALEAAPAYIGGELVLRGGCLLLEDETDYFTIPAFSSAGEPAADDEGLTFDGRDYDLDTEVGFNGSFLADEDDLEVTLPAGCPEDVDVLLIHATTG